MVGPGLTCQGYHQGQRAILTDRNEKAAAASFCEDRRRSVAPCRAALTLAKSLTLFGKEGPLFFVLVLFVLLLACVLLCAKAFAFTCALPLPIRVATPFHQGVGYLCRC